MPPILPDSSMFDIAEPYQTTYNNELFLARDILIRKHKRIAAPPFFDQIYAIYVVKFNATLLPLDKVQITFDDLRTNSSENTRQMLHQLFLYFDNHWMKSIPLALWNAHGYNHRTNSICQDFHNRLNQCIQKSHPNIWSFIKCLQGEEARFRHMLLRINVGAQRRRKIVSTNAIQQRINTLNECYTNNEIDRNQLLDGLSLIVAK
ncbi:unnamed protein product [Rotaria sordida]|uniref:Uncharacterized protein n=1 Tax=Rotaria sordida TaxID=392033 RepID=A0A814RT32_9BILA|nr:unnamed protein product [Rotaria sordida]CAF1137053.1 unnamed protein product [Rotaria sordida]